jgi:hypothetical protein
LESPRLPLFLPLATARLGQFWKVRVGKFWRAPKTKATFVELVAPRPATLEDCVIEFESAGGGKMRIHWKASAPPDWAGLLRAWRDAER